MQIRVVRDGPVPVPPLQYGDLKVGEAFVYADVPESVFIRTSAGALRLRDFTLVAELNPKAPVVRVLMTITWGP